MMAVLFPDNDFHNTLAGAFREATRRIYGFPRNTDIFLVDMESSGCPTAPLVLMHQTRAFKNIQHMYRKDLPLQQLLEVQKYETRTGIGLYRPTIEKALADATATRVRRGDCGDQTDNKRGIFPRESTNQEVKTSAKTLRVTTSRMALLEGSSDSNLTSVRFGSRPNVDRALAFYKCPVPITPFYRNLYCSGVGATTSECELFPGIYRLSMPGPGVPSLLSACSISMPAGAPQLALRMGRLGYILRFFIPSPPPGFFRKKNLYIRFKVAETCPLCASDNEAVDGPPHLLLSCKHPSLQTLQTIMRRDAADVIPKICKHLKSGLQSSTKLSKEHDDKLKAAVEEVETLCRKGNLNHNNEDANNCIYRILAMVPFPAKLAGDETMSKNNPTLRAIGKVFDLIGCSRQVLRGASNLMVSWGSNWIRRFSEKRGELLPPEYYFEKRERTEEDVVATEEFLDEMEHEMEAVWENEVVEGRDTLLGNELPIHEQDELHEEYDHIDPMITQDIVHDAAVHDTATA
jgi:hypothetical protein